MIILCLIIVLVLSAIAVSVGQVIAARYASTKRSTYEINAVMVAEAGLSDTIARLTSDSSFTGYPDNARKQFFNGTDQGKGEYSSTVTAPTATTRIITVTGYVYKDPSSTANEIKKTIRSTVNAQLNPTKYSIFSGPGGLSLNTGVTLLGSDIYVLGKVSLGLGSGIGTYSNPVNLHAANIACRAGGAGSQYPVLCPAADPPLSMSVLSSIYGEVCATGQTSGAGIYPGVTGQGFVNPCTAASGSMPLFDKAGFTSSMNTPAQSSSNAACQHPSNNVTWNANTKFTGDVSFSTVCKVTVKGNIYITGNLTTNLFVHFLVDESLTTPPIIVVNGNVTVNFSRVSANSAGVPMRIISFNSTDNGPSGCSNSDTCNALTNYDDMYNSASLTTASCLGSPHGDMPGLVFQAYYGRANVSFGCNAGSVAGQAVNFDAFSGTSIVGQLSLQGTVTISGWKIVDYQQTY